MSSEESTAVAAFALFIVPYLSYWFFLKSARVREAFVRRFGEQESLVRVTVARAAFAVFAGLAPALALPRISGRPLTFFGLAFTGGLGNAAISSAAACICFAVLFVSPKRPADLALYPLMRAPQWGPREWIADSAGWVVYLGAYEFALRGYLLSAARGAGLASWSAVIAVNALYVAIHIPKGIHEAILAAPFGILLSWASLSTGSVEIAFAAHLGVAMGNDFGAVRSRRLIMEALQRAPMARRLKDRRPV